MLRPEPTEREPRGDRLARMEDVLSRQRQRARPAPRPQPSGVRRRLAAVAFAIGLALFLISLGLSTVSSAAAAERIIGRNVPTLTEEDSLLALHLSDLRAQANAAAGKPVSLPWFPVAVSLPAPLLANGSTQAIEARLNQAAAQALYQRGESAFSSAGSSRVTGPLLSPIWTLRQALGLLNVGAHARLLVATGILALIAAALALPFCVQAGASRWLAGLGASGMIGAALAGVVAGFAWLLVQFNAAGAPSPLGDAAWSMLSDVTWTMLAMDGVVLLCSAALLLLGLVVARLGTAQRAAGAPERSTGPALSSMPAPPRERPIDRLPRARRRFD